MDNTVTISMEDPGQPDILTLLRDGEANSARLYPAESIHQLPLDRLRATDVRFMVARDANSRAVGTGAVVLHGDWAELKRMWVVPEARGRGIAKAVLAVLIATARREEGVVTLRLETGVASHAALRLYATSGFRRRDPFDGYQDDPLSVFMEYTIEQQAGEQQAG